MSMLDALVARWRDHKANVAAIREIRACDPDTVAELASELGMSVRELEQVASRGAGADRLMARMIEAFGLDGEKLQHHEPTTLRDMSLLCSLCDAKGRCGRELEAGTAAEHAEAFCPNAGTFARLVAETATH